MNRDDLIAFEEVIADDFNAGKIRYPVHLESGNEDQLIKVFEQVKPEDWVFVSWRGHLKALLKGVPPNDLIAAIYRGESMALNFPEQRVYGSAIVGGTIPIALGAALAIKRKGGNEKVHCFVGDMGSYTGIFSECVRYSQNFLLPIHFIIEDNNLSVCTNTREVWGGGPWQQEKVSLYQYKSKYPHCGAGKRVQF